MDEVVEFTNYQEPMSVPDYNMLPDALVYNWEPTPEIMGQKIVQEKVEDQDEKFKLFVFRWLVTISILMLLLISLMHW